jgi:hypothetical protein
VIRPVCIIPGPGAPGYTGLNSTTQQLTQSQTGGYTETGDNFDAALAG